MTQMKYKDFALTIQREGDGYRAKVRSPGGEDSVVFQNPFTDDELEQFLDLLGHPGQNVQETEDAARDFGSRLFQAVFAGGVNTRLHVSLSEVAEQFGLRIQLNLSEVPELAALPWEYLYDPDFGQVSRLSKTPVVRYIDLKRPNKALGIKLPLRILVMISSPGDYAPLDVSKEWGKLNRSLKELIDRRMVELVLLKEATIPALLDQFRNPPFHVFHFIGHGGYDSATGDGYLVFEEPVEDDEGIGETDDRRSRGHRVNGERVANLLQNHGSLRLAVINACEGARASVANPFGGVAQSLVRASIPAVVSMQFPITDEAAIAFAAEFYKAIADYYPVDAALVDARNRMNDAEWGTPALYMRSPDGCIFEAPPGNGPISPPPPGPWPPIQIHCDDIASAIKEGSLVPFLGPGANLCGHEELKDWERVPYAPSDRELAAYLSRSTGNIRELVQVSQDIDLESATSLSRDLHQVLTRDFKATRLHSFLATIPRILRETVESPSYPLIVTSNYDDVLEREFKQQRVEYDLVSYIARGKDRGRFSLTPHGGKPVTLTKPNSYLLTFDERTVILKIHGAVNRHDAKEDGFVITEDHYIDYLVKKNFFNLVPPKVVEKLCNGNLLFLGYRLRGWNLRIIMRRIWGEQTFQSASWAIEDGPAEDEQYWKKRNVKVLGLGLQDFVEEMEKRLKVKGV
ncbi:MAG TPA: CHAT domain-containing protein [Blastocatellia bacterium]|nr:CHAT domain-containing protein [Blastocatellia bacterium]